MTLSGVRAIDSLAMIRNGAFRPFAAQTRVFRKQTAVRSQPQTEAIVDLPVTNAPEARLQPMDILKPYLMLACVAFTIGFVGYWALGQALAPSYPASADAQVQGPITTSTPELPLADGKRI